MIQNEKNSNCKKKPLLLFSPLDWGLGHTTRSIPVLNEFLEQGFKIVVACNSTQKLILGSELPSLEFAFLDGYGVKYTRNGRLFRWKIGGQLINILTQIKRENRWVREFVANNRADLILSDNRYGFFHPSLPSFFITHQLRPKTGFGRKADDLVQKFLYRYINRFTECWIPDRSSPPHLSGDLSHTNKLPRIPVKFIGHLTRFHINPNSITENDLLLVILSGPEPQRSVFESILMNQFINLKNKIVFVRGLPGNDVLPGPIPGIEFYNHVSAAELNVLAQKCGYVICRPGYTSLMDMIALKKKMIVVPTPGQSEQEYLANHLSENNMAPAFPQHNFDVQKALALAGNFEYRLPELDLDIYKEAVGKITASICKTANCETPS